MSTTEARRAIRTCGGLLAQADIARRFGRSRQAILYWTRAPDFPVPVANVGRSPVWLAVEVDEWVRFHGIARTPEQTRGGENQK